MEDTMGRKGLLGLLLAVVVISGNTCWALDEGALTPTVGTSVSQDEQEFQGAMAVWYKHDYKNGEKMLRKFAKEHPDSQWAAEAELHVGCNLVYQKKYSEAKPIFEKLVAKHPDSNIALKAKIRLGNVAEQTGDYAGAIRHFRQVLDGGWTPNQFRYANNRMSKLVRLRAGKLALIKCGPVALASCLEALGKEPEAAKAKELNPGEDGLSLAALQAEAETLGVKAIPVQMSLDDLKAAKLPVLAFLKPNHFVAILSLVKDRAQLVDSIRGKHELTISELQSRWDGRTLVFDLSANLKPLAAGEAEQAVGGCCGVPPEDSCDGSPTCPNCDMPFDGSGAGGDGFGMGGGSGPGMGGGGGSCPTCPRSSGSPTWKVNAILLNLVAEDTPIWYDPGRGPKIAFTLTYSNNNSNKGIFGIGWRCIYDMRVFSLPYSTSLQTVTTEEMTTSSTTVYVDSTAGFPASGTIIVRSENESEIIAYESKQGTSFEGLTRGPNPIGAPIDSSVELYAPSLQVHRDNGRIETYDWNTSLGGYAATSLYAEYGYKDSVQKEGEITTLNLQGEGKYVFNQDGRISEIWDSIGNHVTCGYTGGKLTSITDANGHETVITLKAGAEELVDTITLPDGRTAEFDYTDGFLMNITDMGGHTSELFYDARPSTIPPTTTLSNALDTDDTFVQVSEARGFPRYGSIVVGSGGNMELISYADRGIDSFVDISRGSPPINANISSPVNMPSTTLDQNVTDVDPDDDGNLAVVSTAGFPTNGAIKVNNAEVMTYKGKTGISFSHIRRGEKAYASSGQPVVSLPTIPYLSRIETPTEIVDFEYQWYYDDIYYSRGSYVALEKAFEYGSGESKPDFPTWYFKHGPNSAKEWIETEVMHYPHMGSSGYESGLTKMYIAGVDGLLWSITDKSGSTVNDVVTYEYDYDSERNPARIVNGSQLSEAQRRTTELEYVYDGYSHNDDMLTRTDPVQYDLDPQHPTTTYTYENHRVKTMTDASNRLVHQYDYNSAGQVDNIWTQPNSGPQVKLTKNIYDGEGRLSASKTYPTGTETDETAPTTVYYYDGIAEPRGFLTSVEDPEHHQTYYTYDDQGRKETVTDPDGRVTRYVYDNLDRVVKVIYPDDTPGNPNDNPYVQNEYTCCHLDWKKDENGRQTTYNYDEKNRLDYITDSAGGVTRYTYDLLILDRVIAIEDPKQSEVNDPLQLPLPRYATYYEYYDNGKLKRITYADDTWENPTDNLWEQYEYNCFGEMTKKTDSKGRRIDYQYDKNGRLIRICPL